VGAVTTWTERAADATKALVASFWDDRRQLFRISTARRWPLGSWHYWWQAHALDALTLAGDADRAPRLVDGVLRRNGGRITNDYYDDMAWMGLALHGATAAGLVSAEPLVEELTAELRGGIDPAYGAVRWRRGDTFLNVPANAPTATLAARTGDRALAEQLTDWIHATLVTPDGVVYDGIRPGQGIVTSQWSYNYGTVIGADVTLGALDRARVVAAAAERELVRADGVVRDEGGGDGGLFKGIFARNLGAFVLATDDAAARDLLLRNAETAWASRSPDGLVGPDWSRPPEGPVELSTHLSGVLLFHTVAGLGA
jgi:predicted alpha-1,6-mannanase (GH76 family)